MNAVELIVSLERVRRSRVRLLSTRLEVAATMMSMAENAVDWPQAQRLEAVARRSYEAVARDFLRARFSADEIERFTEQVVSISKRLHIFRTAAPLRERVAIRDARARLIASCWRIDPPSGELSSSELPQDRPARVERRWRDLDEINYARRIH